MIVPMPKNQIDKIAILSRAVFLRQNRSLVSAKILQTFCLEE